jgi:predicted DNA-binding antitoxin AbrB/MazE fold protein
MVRHIDAIFSHGAFQPVEPLTLPEGARVRLRVVEALPAGGEPAPIIRSPKLAHPEDAADFVLEVREAGDAGI